MVHFRLVSSMCVATLCCLPFAGCSQSTPGPSPESIAEAESGRPMRVNAPAMLTAPHSVKPLQTAKQLQMVSQQAGSAVSDTAAQDDARTHKLFEHLFTPGITAEEWDQTHESLIELGEKAVSVLAEKLRRGNPAERELAATTLALFGETAALATPELVYALKDESDFVKANAAAALVQIPSQAEEAIPTLVTLLSAEDHQLRQLAAVNLNAAGLAIPAHLNSLKNVLAENNSAEVLTPVVELLGRIGPTAHEVLPELQKIAFEQSGELSQAAQSAIQLISGTQEQDN